MEIICLPVQGTDITNGFSCNFDNSNAGELGSVISVDDGQGGLMYIDRAWSGADVYICLFIFIFLVLKITEIMFNFFLPTITRIRKK